MKDTKEDNVNKINDDEQEKIEPTNFKGKDNENIDTDDLNKTSTSTSETTKSIVNSSSIFGLVKSMFSSVTAQFSLSFNFGNFFNSPPVQNFRQFLFGNFHQPQYPNRGGLVPLQNFFGSQNQFSYSSNSNTIMTLDEKGDKEIWLNEDSEEVTINATETTGINILAGNNKDNQIFGGKGHNDMWGGSYHTNDYLFGGEGQNTFWYGKGEGVDLVENTKKGDTINLYNITLGDIANVEITDSSISIVVGKDEGVAINSSDEISPTFKLSNGESYNYNRSSAEWQKA